VSEVQVYIGKDPVARAGVAARARAGEQTGLASQGCHGRHAPARLWSSLAGPHRRPARGLWALEWADVDLDAGTVRIARSILDLPGRSTRSHQSALSLWEMPASLCCVCVATTAGLPQIGGIELVHVFSDGIEGHRVPERSPRIGGRSRRMRSSVCP